MTRRHYVLGNLLTRPRLDAKTQCSEHARGSIGRGRSRRCLRVNSSHLINDWQPAPETPVRFRRTLGELHRSNSRLQAWGALRAPRGHLFVVAGDATPDPDVPSRRVICQTARSVCVLVATLAPFTFQGQAGSAQRSLPPPTDIDAQFTEQLGQAEQQFCEAVLNKDARDFGQSCESELRAGVADVPEAACRVPFGWTTLCTGSRANIASNITSSRANSPTISRLSAWSGVRKGRPMDETQRRLLWSSFGRRAAEIGRLSPGPPLRSASFPSGQPDCRPWPDGQP